MKTWNEIEQRLRNEPAPAPSPALHDRIVRAVRDERAAAVSAHPHSFVSSWWVTATLAAACAVVALVVMRPRAETTPLGAPSVSFALIESLASAPVENEWQNLRTDLASAAEHLTACVPDIGGHSL